MFRQPRLNHVHVRTATLQKIRAHTYIWAGSGTRTRAYVRPGLVYMESQHTAATASFSSADRTEKQRRVHREATDWVGMRPIHREPTYLDGTAETGSSIPQNGGNGLLLDCLGSTRDPVHQEGCGVPQNGTPRATVHPRSTSL